MHSAVVSRAESPIDGSDQALHTTPTAAILRNDIQESLRGLDPPLVNTPLPSAAPIQKQDHPNGILPFVNPGMPMNQQLYSDRWLDLDAGLQVTNNSFDDFGFGDTTNFGLDTGMSMPTTLPIQNDQQSVAVDAWSRFLEQVGCIGAETADPFGMSEYMK